MAKNLLRRVMTASFRGAENADVRNVTSRLVPAHEAITPSSGSSGADDLRPDRTPAASPVSFGQQHSSHGGRKASPKCRRTGWARVRLRSSAILAAWRFADQDPRSLDWLS